MLKKLFIFLLILILGAVLVFGYYGFVPGVSAIFGSDKPRDLGAKPSKEAFASFTAKSNISFGELPATADPTKSISFEGVTNIDAELTAEEIISIPENAPWKYFPVEHPQMRFNKDGSQELSGVVDTGKVADYLRAHNIDTKPLDSYLSKLTAIGAKVPVYAKGASSWKNNQLTLETQVVEVGRYKVDSATIAKYNDQIVAGIETLVSSVPRLSVSSISFKDGKLHAQGTFPQKVSVAGE